MADNPVTTAEGHIAIMLAIISNMGLVICSWLTNRKKITEVHNKLNGNMSEEVARVVRAELERRDTIE